MNLTKRQNWKKSNLSNFYWFQEGPGVRNWQFTTSGIKLINVANITKFGTIDLSKTERCLSFEEVEQKYNHFLIDKGDLVIASSGISFDSDGLLRTRGAFVDVKDLPLCMNTSTIRFKSEEGISDLNFLKFWLDSLEFREQITRLVTGSAQQNFGPSHLKKLCISMPPLEEQKRIVRILAKCDRIRRTRRDTQQLSDTYLQSVFLEMFGDPVTNTKGWKKKTLGELDTSFVYGTSEKCFKEEFGLPVLRIPNILGGSIDTSNLKYAQLSSREVAQLTLQKGDLLFVRTNGNLDYVGRCAVFELETPFLFASYLIRARLDLKCIDPWFASAYLRTTLGREIMAPFIRTTAGQFNISTTGLKQITIPLPPLKLQEKFAQIVQKYGRLRTQQREATRQAEHLFQTTLHRAFSGEL
jgi:type I restriction enzyme, S subunit